VTEWHHESYVVTDDPARVDLDVVHGYLSNESYWARGRSRADTETAIGASWCFSVIESATGAQVGFARIVTDRVTHGWLADVFVVPAAQGHGLGTFLVGCVAEAAAGITHLDLRTRDAHGLYAKFGFTPLPHPQRSMERLLPPRSDA
jgi:GNAT superfamily N-acetyltransferase